MVCTKPWLQKGDTARDKTKFTAATLSIRDTKAENTYVQYIFRIKSEISQPQNQIRDTFEYS